MCPEKITAVTRTSSWTFLLSPVYWVQLLLVTVLCLRACGKSQLLCSLTFNKVLTSHWLVFSGPCWCCSWVRLSRSGFWCTSYSLEASMVPGGGSSIRTLLMSDRKCCARASRGRGVGFTPLVFLLSHLTAHFWAWSASWRSAHSKTSNIQLSFTS